MSRVSTIAPAAALCDMVHLVARRYIAPISYDGHAMHQRFGGIARLEVSVAVPIDVHADRWPALIWRANLDYCRELGAP